jgi:hypothetical protein
MAIGATDVTTVTGVTYGASSDPTSTQVGTFITAGKGLYQSIAGAAPVETDNAVVYTVCEIVADLISNYLRQKMLSNPSNMAGTVPEYRNPLPQQRVSTIKAQVTTEFDDSGSSFSFAW